ncbi:helix-turn-helix domain-containing protein [uncultured Phascolarctobacterium sp.]|jgi:toxin-antitoxin system, antitoxin component, xre family|uniref:helix-turn-helix domain-containing protein n=1 Tax=Phascolarctobacterium faecium TaxID=33025 RepID=UPI0026275D01|nr:helix-turn-helix transcriptional regulator [uncultured Phascolarctobacterium sp.]
MKLGERIKSYRLTKKLTLKDIALHLGVSEATAQRYESGKITTIDYDKIIILSKLFDCSPTELMGWETNRDTSLELANDEKTFLEKFRKLSHDDQMLLFGIMDSFIDRRNSVSLPATGTK